MRLVILNLLKNRKKMKLRLILLLFIIHVTLFTSLSAQNRRSSSSTKASVPASKPTSPEKNTKPTLQVKSKEVPVDPPKPSKNIASNYSKLGIQLEAGMLPIQSLNSATINSYNGSLGLNYNLFSNFHIGLFGQSLLYHQNLDVANIDNKIIDLSSIEYNSVGLRLLYKIPLGKFSITPQLDASYDFFISKAIDFGQDKKAFLDYRYLTLTPKLNLGFNITESTMLGIFGGYNYQLTAIKGKQLEEFNPTGVTGGVMMQVQIVR
jgi:TonB dependent receptor